MLVAVVELEPDGDVAGGAAEVELEDKEVVDELDAGREVAACCVDEHAAQTIANNPIASATEDGRFETVIEDRRSLVELQLGIVGGELDDAPVSRGIIDDLGTVNAADDKLQRVARSTSSRDALSSSVHDPRLPAEGEPQPIGQSAQRTGAPANIGTEFPASVQEPSPEMSRAPVPKGTGALDC